MTELSHFKKLLNGATTTEERTKIIEAMFDVAVLLDSYNRCHTVDTCVGREMTNSIKRMIVDKLKILTVQSG
jgi:hypothetical protein